MRSASEDGDRLGRAALGLAALAGLVFLAHVIDAHWRPTAARVTVAAVVFAGLAFGRGVLRSRWCWLALTGALAWVLLRSPYQLGNHHYLLCYVGLAMVLCSGRDDRRFLEDMSVNLRWFLVAVMSIAVVQRLLSPTFLDGSYLALMLARGNFFRAVYALCDSCRELVDVNVALIAAANRQNPNVARAVVLREPFPELALAARGFAYFILAVELWIAAAFAFFRSAWVRHSALLPFVIVLGFTREEFVFASLLALIGLGTCSIEHRRLRTVYAATAVVLTASVFLFPVETGV